MLGMLVRCLCHVEFGVRIQKGHSHRQLLVGRYHCFSLVESWHYIRRLTGMTRVLKRCLSGGLV